MEEQTYKYDDLRQHQKEGKMRRIMTASLLVAVVCLVFGICSTMTALHIKKQKKQAELQVEQTRKQSQDIQTVSDERRKQNEELAFRQALALAERATEYYESGDSTNAVKTALVALTESDGIEMPYTPEAQYILTGSTRAYDTGSAYKAAYQYEMSGEIKYMDISPEKNVVALGDATGRLVLFDLEQRKDIDTVINRYMPKNFNSQQAFLSGGRFAYMDSDGRVAIYDIGEKEVIQRLDCGYARAIYADKEGKYLLAYDSKEGYVYAGDTLQHMVTIHMPDDVGYEYSCYVFSEGIITFEYSKYEEGQTVRTLYFLNIESGQLIYSHEIADKNLEDIQIRNGVAYALLAHNQNANLDCDMYVTAISIENGEILWENMIQGARPESLCLPTKPNGTELACSTNDSVRLMDMQTGEITGVWSLNSKVVMLYSFQNKNDWFLILENGEFWMINRDGRILLGMSHLLHCKSLRNAYAFLIPGYGVVIQEVEDNKITVYTAERGPNVKEISEEVKKPELPKEFYGSDAFNLASFYDLERPDYIYRMYHSEDEKYCIVYYWDGDMAIYDTEQRNVLNVIEDTIDTYWCLGTDAEGYTYLLTYSGCYVLNRDMEPIAWIEDVQNVDVEKRMVYMMVGGEYFEAPIYSLEELLEIAKSKQ